MHTTIESNKSMLSTHSVKELHQVLLRRVHGRRVWRHAKIWSMSARLRICRGRYRVQAAEHEGIRVALKTIDEPPHLVACSLSRTHEDRDSGASSAASKACGLRGTRMSRTRSVRQSLVAIQAPQQHLDGRAR